MSMFGEKSEKQKMFRRALLERRPKPLNRRGVLLQTSSRSWDSLALWLVFVGITGYILFFSGWLLVTDVRLEGESVLSTKDLTNFVTSHIEGKFLKVIPKGNYFFVSSDVVARALKEQYPKFSSVQVEKIFPNELRIRYEEYTTLLRWCSGGPCYILSENEMLQSAERTELPEYESSRLTLVDQSAPALTLGQVLPVKDFLQSFREFFQLFPSLIALELEPFAETPSRYAPEIRLHTREGWDLMVSTERSPRESLETLRVFLDSQSLILEKRKNLLSLDLRTEGRVFILWKENPQKTSEALSAETSLKKPE